MRRRKLKKGAIRTVVEQQEMRIFDHRCTQCGTLFKSERPDAMCPGFGCMNMCHTQSSHVGTMQKEALLATSLRHDLHRRTWTR